MTERAENQGLDRIDRALAEVDAGLVTVYEDEETFIASLDGAATEPAQPEEEKARRREAVERAREERRGDFG